MGIEVDGPVVRVVTVDARGVVTYRANEAKNSGDALEAALKGVRKSDIDRVAWTGGRQYVRRLSIPDVPSAAMRAAMQAVAEEQLPIVPGATSIGGLLLPADAATAVPGERPMIVAAVESDDLDPLWRRLGGRRAPITASALLLPGDGCYLRVARSTAELVLVSQSVPVAARVLQAGGVAHLVRAVGGDGASLHDVMTVVTGAAPGDTGAIDGYLDALVADVRRTVVFWRREGLMVPDDLLLIGEGAALPTLRSRLRDAGFSTRPLPLVPGLDLSQVSELDRPAAFQALASAVIDLSMQPFATLPNPVYDAAVEKRKHGSKRVRNLVVMLAIIGAVSAALAFPWFKARAELVVANTQQSSAQEELNGLSKYDDLAQLHASGKAAQSAATKGQPAWSDVIDAVYTNKPEGTDIESVRFTNSDGDVKVSISATINSAQAFKPVADWIRKVEAAGAQNTWSNQQSFEGANGAQKLTIQFTLPKAKPAQGGTK
ncbi:MAG: hypothetical protein ACOYNI_10395 [Acidimicrobiia bacterium]